ncbi:response regulator transcription factor [soil metagenome]
MRVLVVEDELALATGIADYLKKDGYVCDIAGTVSSTLRTLAANTYDCILLDIMLPDGTGLSVLEYLRREMREDGIIIISSRDGTPDKVQGLLKGADDYLTKPFHLSELSARVMAIVRRKQFKASNVIESNELRVDLVSKEASVRGTIVHLTVKEFALLVFLLANRKRVVSLTAIAEHLSGNMADTLHDHSFVYSHMKNLKKKLADSGCSDYIETKYGLGYKWNF